MELLRQHVRSLLVELKDMPLLGDVPGGPTRSEHEQHRKDTQRWSRRS